MTRNSEFFRFAAKAGSLEGYLFKRDKVEPLSDWIGNIEKMYQALPASVKKDIREDFRGVLQRILEYGDRVLEAELKEKLNNLLKAVQKGS
jgi:hypothetical protein